MMKKEFIGLIAVAVIILIILSSFILYNQWPAMTGKKIILSTQPVDPFDLFMGQYMTINYEISRIEVTGFEEGDRIYVSLEPDDQSIWRRTGVSSTKPRIGDFIKGKVTYVRGNNIRVEFGIEQFYFERHAQLPTRNITVEINVASSGRARLSQMLHNGEPIEIEYEEFDIKS